MEGFAILLLAFKAVTIASLPLGAIWIGRANAARGDRLRRLAWATAFLTFDLVVFGAFTRLTDSGLGCPDWPGCYAQANPWLAAPDIHHAESVLPSGPVTMQKAWIEMIHRYLAMAIGLLIIVMLGISVLRSRRRSGEPGQPLFAAVLLAVVVLQGAFGAWTVTQRLQPIFVTTHLLLGLALLALLVWHALGFDATRVAPSATRAAHAAPVAFARFAFVVVALQAALGGWVSANYAVLACNDFPTCQGVWLPTMDFRDAFHLWRPLGLTADGHYLSIEALTAIHWTHRTFAVFVFAVLTGLVWRLRSIGWVGPAIVVAALLVAQVATGFVSVVLAWPLVAAVLHNAGAAGLVVTLTVINYRLSARAPRTLDEGARSESAEVRLNDPRRLARAIR